MARLKGLGRGLDALLSTANETPAELLQTLDVGLLSPGRYQPRTRMDEASLAELAESIRAQGVMQPVLVRPVASGGYEIIAGERRWRAAQLVGLTSIPAVVRDVPDESALAMALIENIQRENLNPLEEAAGIQRLIDEFAMTHEQAAQAVGRSRSAVSNLLRLLNLPEPVRELVFEGRLEMGHARALLPLPAAMQIETAHLANHRGLSVREVERLVQKLLKAPAQRAAVSLSRDVVRLQEELSDAIGAVVRINPGQKGAGRLVIEYASLDHLDGILQRLRR